ncbi:membrane protein [Herminiimonas sp. CN]|uniref:outer membrane lipoprotein n=1 Tax=Herminiimonas sp. CN TaxID=1349818 RepID=UPI0004742AB4|nr:membrane protein [Herminiimonas sp. CN]
MKKLILVASLTMTALAGCAVTPNSANVYSSRQAQGEQTVRMGVVESVREVSIDKGSSGVGQLAGGAVGAVAAGSSIGGGNGSIVAGILGAVAGGLVGQNVEANMVNRRGLEITVRLDSGSLTAITQDADEMFRAGERVRLLSSGRTARVTH